MEAKRNIISRRIVGVRATLTEDEVHQACARFVLMHHAQDLLKEFDNMGASQGDISIDVRIDDRLGEADVHITYTIDVEVAP